MLSAGLPGWADAILSAVTQLLDDEELDLQLMATVLLELEGLALSQLHAGDYAVQGEHEGNRVCTGSLAGALICAAVCMHVLVGLCTLTTYACL